MNPSCRLVITGWNIIPVSISLKTDLNQTQKLIPFVPKDVITVSESGIRSFKDVLWLKGLEVDAILVGDALMKADNIEEKIKELHIDP